MSDFFLPKGYFIIISRYNVKATKKAPKNDNFRVDKTKITVIVIIEQTKQIEQDKNREVKK